MGSFNTTCFASQQTIAPRDRCYVLPILQKSTYKPVSMTHDGKTHSFDGVSNSTCYPDAFWAPFGGLLEATYDDYGRVNLEPSVANRHALLNFFAAIETRTPVILEGENDCHDLPFDFAAVLEQAPGLQAFLAKRGADEAAARPNVEAFDLDSEAAWGAIWEVAQEHRLFATDYRGVPRPLQFAIMHGAAFDALIALCASAPRYDGAPGSMRDFFDRGLASAEALCTPGVSTDTTDFLFFDRFRSHLATLNNQGSAAFHGEGAAINQLLRAYRSGVATADQVYKAMAPLLALRYALSGLDTLNVKLSPMVYASQDYDNGIGRAYARFIRATSAAVSRGRAQPD